jgi:hypothetical protein
VGKDLASVLLLTALPGDVCPAPQIVSERVVWQTVHGPPPLDRTIAFQHFLI